MLRTIAAGTLIVLAVSTFGVQSCAQTTEIYRTRDALSGSLVVGTGTPYLFTPLYQLSIDVEPGDVVDVTGFVQVSTLFDHSVMVGKYLLSHTGSEIAPGQHGGSYLARPHTQNVRKVIRHNPMWIAGAEKVTTTGTRLYTLVGYAASVYAVPGDELTIDNYGELTARVTRTCDS